MPDAELTNYLIHLTRRDPAIARREVRRFVGMGDLTPQEADEIHIRATRPEKIERNITRNELRDAVLAESRRRQAQH